MSARRGGTPGAAELPHERVIFHLDDGTIVDGTLTIPRPGMRMSDYLTGSEREFINVGDATVTFADDRRESSPFVMIARKSIRMVTPAPRDETDTGGADLSAWEPAPAGSGSAEQKR